jgi:hypothetical protein
MLINLATYGLPDGAHVIARQDVVSKRWRLDALDGTPRYLEASGGGLLRLVYDAGADAYAAVPCDLTLADLRYVEEPNV